VMKYHGFMALCYVMRCAEGSLQVLFYDLSINAD
jgi:hypothetical protein